MTRRSWREIHGKTSQPRGIVRQWYGEGRQGLAQKFETLVHQSQDTVPVRGEHIGEEVVAEGRRWIVFL